jgi:hypothetical protein
MGWVDVRVGHEMDEFAEGGGWFPAEGGVSFGVVTHEVIDFGWSEVLGIDDNIFFRVSAASRFPRNSFVWRPALMRPTARVILRVTKVSPRRGDSWLKRMSRPGL